MPRKKREIPNCKEHGYFTGVYRSKTENQKGNKINYTDFNEDNDDEVYPQYLQLISQINKITLVDKRTTTGYSLK